MRDAIVIAILDYGMGNVRSIQNMLRRAGAASSITSSPADIDDATALILPGVGAFDEGMRRINRLGLRDLLNRVALVKRIPILGICLGMQLLTKSSEEGKLPGLGWIDATTIRFRFDHSCDELKVPHMGWNGVRVQRSHYVFDGIESPRFYFVHSYHVCCEDQTNVLATAQYGVEFTSAVVSGNIVGTQFHPEKSHKFGLSLLKNFTRSVQYDARTCNAMFADQKRWAG
jgi:glutamine amidotransferase